MGRFRIRLSRHAGVASPPRGGKDLATGLRIAPLTIAETLEAQRAEGAEAIAQAWAEWERNLGGGRPASPA